MPTDEYTGEQMRMVLEVQLDRPFVFGGLDDAAQSRPWIRMDGTGRRNRPGACAAGQWVMHWD